MRCQQPNHQNPRRVWNRTLAHEWTLCLHSHWLQQWAWAMDSPVRRWREVCHKSQSALIQLWWLPLWHNSFSLYRQLVQSMDLMRRYCFWCPRNLARLWVFSGHQSKSGPGGERCIWFKEFFDILRHWSRRRKCLRRTIRIQNLELPLLQLLLHVWYHRQRLRLIASRSEKHHCHCRDRHLWRHVDHHFGVILHHFIRIRDLS